MKKIKKTEINNIHNIKSKTNTNNIEVSDMNSFDSEKFYFTNFYEENKLTRFIKNVERMIRTSEEYKHYIGFLKSNLGLNSCAILGNVVGEGNISIEQHHYPYTLYDIVYVNILDKFLKNERITSYRVAKDVLHDHYNNIIGLVPLCKTVHELVHDKVIFVNINSIYGNINAFNEKYDLSLTEPMKEMYNTILEMSDKNIVYNENDILKYLKAYENKKTE